MNSKIGNKCTFNGKLSRRLRKKLRNDEKILTIHTTLNAKKKKCIESENLSQLRKKLKS